MRQVTTINPNERNALRWLKRGLDWDRSLAQLRDPHEAPSVDVGVAVEPAEARPAA